MARVFSLSRVCEKCGNDFIVDAPKRRTCQECRKCKWCGENLTQSRSQFCNSSCFGKWNVEQNGSNILWDSMTVESQGRRRESLSIAKTGVARTDRGELNANWKGNKSERRTAMERLEYKVWRATVFKRDNYTCVLCHEQVRKMEAHHIKPWADHIELRYDVNNGVTLCESCHDKIASREGEFEDRFTQYVNLSTPAELTADERATFESIYVQCSYCGKDKRIYPCHRKKQWHFCDMTCKRAYEKDIGSSWRTHGK